MKRLYICDAAIRLLRLGNGVPFRFAEPSSTGKGETVWEFVTCGTMMGARAVSTSG